MKRPNFDEIRAKLGQTGQNVRGWFSRLSSRLPRRPRGADSGAAEPEGLIEAPAAVDWKERVRAAVPRVLSALASAGERASALVQKQGSGLYGTAITLLLCAFFLADLAAILLEGFIPESKGPRSTAPVRSEAPRTMAHYNRIISRNLFNAKVDEGGAKDTKAPEPIDGPAVKTNLPLALVGTIITRDPRHSVATIEDKSGQTVYPMRVDDEIPSRIRVIEILARKVTFVNLQSGRKEYVDLPEDAQLKGRPVATRASKPSGGGGIVQKTQNQFNIARTEIDNALQDLNKVLTQARAVPHYENGMPAGFKLFQIVPGSLYDKLGFQNGDVLAGVNGEPVDAGKAFEMLNDLKTTNHVEISIKRNGREETLVYDIN